MSDGLFIALLIFTVALVYASVGHGGASGYLGVLAFFHFAPVPMASSALILNLVVAGLAWVSFARSDYFSMRLIAPFLLFSIPMAVLGGALKISLPVYGILLAISLILAALRLMMRLNPMDSGNDETASPGWIAAPLGGLIGLISGTVGVGGGIFLSPILILAGWAGPKRTAAVSAFFIWANSLAGLLGRGFSGQLDASLVVPFVIPAFAGGLIGSQWGANRFSSNNLRCLLGIVLLLAAWKILIRAVS